MNQSKINTYEDKPIRSWSMTEFLNHTFKNLIPWPCYGDILILKEKKYL